MTQYTTTNTFITIPNLSPNTRYSVTIKSYNSDISSVFSQPIEVDTLTTPLTIATITTSATTIEIGWTAISATAYKVLWSTDLSFSNDSGPLSSSATNYTITGLTINTNYYIKAISANYNGIYGPDSNILYEEASPFPAPTGLEATGETSTTIALSWDSASSATDYKVEWDTGSVSTTGSATTYTITGLTPATLYSQIAVAAIYSGGSSVFSATISVATTISAPTDIPGCILWLDAQDNGTITKTGTLLTAWTDKSGHSASPTSLSAVNVNATGINTYQTMTFVNADDSVIYGATNFAINGTALSAYIVIKITAASTAAGRIISLAAPGEVDYISRDYCAALTFLGSSTDTVFGYSELELSSAPSGIGTGVILSSYFGNEQNVVANNGDQGSIVASVNNFTISNYALGQVSDGTIITDMSIDADVGEIIIYDTTVNTTQDTAILNYLAAKWGISL